MLTKVVFYTQLFDFLLRLCEATRSQRSISIHLFAEKLNRKCSFGRVSCANTSEFACMTHVDTISIVLGCAVFLIFSAAAH